MLFFMDNNLPPALGNAINALCGAEADVTHLQDGFPLNTPDEEWAGSLMRSGQRWAVVTSDKFQKTMEKGNSLEHPAWSGSFFCLDGAAKPTGSNPGN